MKVFIIQCKGIPAIRINANDFRIEQNCFVFYDTDKTFLIASFPIEGVLACYAEASAVVPVTT